MVSGQIYGGGTSFWNGNNFLHMASQDLWQVSIQTEASGAWVAGPSLMERGYSGNGQRSGTLLT